MKDIGRIIPLTPERQDGYTHVDNHSGDIPFRPKRAYWIYGVPEGEGRGGHAHKRLRQVIIAVKGSFTVNLDNGHEKQQYLLHQPDQGLYIDTKIWRTLDNFSPGAVCLVLASEPYEPEDYLYEYDDFLKYISRQDTNE